MIKERMLELLILENIMQFDEIYMLSFDGRYYDGEKMEKRYKELKKEFLEPYVIDTISKE